MWQALGARDAERLTLVWETQELLALNFSIVTFLKDQVCLHAPHFHLLAWESWHIISAEGMTPFQMHCDAQSEQGFSTSL